jgi:cytoskeletal protein CcmA (bactofilin family)
VSEAFRHKEEQVANSQGKEMRDHQVPRGATARLDYVDGDLKVGRGAKIEASSGNLVSVVGAAYFDGGAEIDCDFECDSLRAGHGGALEVNGNLTVRKLLDVDHSVEAGGTVRADEIDIGGRLEAVNVICKRMRVGGKIEVARTLEVESLSVGGKVEAPGTILIKDFEVGGQADIGGGKITGYIRVGGKFESDAKLEFGDLHTFGRTELGAHSLGRKISTTGALTIDGDFECDEMIVSGKSEVNGNLSSKKIRVTGTLEVNGVLRPSELLEVSGSAEVNAAIEGTDIRVGGKLEARKVIATNELGIIGFVKAKDGLKASSVKIGGGSRVEGPIVAVNVDVGKSSHIILDWEKSWFGQIAAARLVGKMTRVEDIYADTVHLGRLSTSGRIFARVIEFEDGSIADEVNYTEEIRGNEERAHFEKPPRKIDRLPQPPEI